MHRVRLAVRENRLSASAGVTEASYAAFCLTGSAWVAEQSAQVTAFAALDRAKASVWALFVEPQMEGLGIGSALLAKLLASAASDGLTRLTLTTGEETRAEHFYLRKGWRSLGESDRGESLLDYTLTAYSNSTIT
jgi:GNAT superfamily N-acetyltransferase